MSMFLGFFIQPRLMHNSLLNRIYRQWKLTLQI